MRWFAARALPFLAIAIACQGRFAAAQFGPAAPPLIATEPPRFEGGPPPVAEMGPDCLCPTIGPFRDWSIDFVVSPMVDSRTSYEFGTPPIAGGPSWAPLSKLDWGLDSVWAGLRVALEREVWDVHFQWLTPLQQAIGGQLADFDFVNPVNTSELDSLTVSRLRWDDGQILQLQGEFMGSDCMLGMPIEVWPLAGFKFERFNMTGFDTTQLVSSPGFLPVGTFIPGPAITFSQQYYLAYFGAQFRTLFYRFCPRPISVMLQADGGPAWGDNVDHHLLREGDRITTESTNGSMFHLGLTGELHLNQRLSIGIQADHTQIRTTGTHHLINAPLNIDESWSNGVAVNSDQTMLSGFVRARF